MKLIFATNNAHKLMEVSRMLDNRFELSTPREVGITEDIPETAPTLEGNALQKARYIYERTGKNCFADDTGLEVEALNGEPGVRSARYATDGHDFRANNELLMKNMKGETNRKANFRTVIALIIDGTEYLFEGRVDGTITTTESGCEGFGYDPIFTPEGYTETFAEMTTDQKGEISHRGRAVAKLVEFLNNL